MNETITMILDQRPCDTANPAFFTAKMAATPAKQSPSEIQSEEKKELRKIKVPRL